MKKCKNTNNKSFIDHLPKDSKGRVNWVESVGYRFKALFNDKEYDFEIISYKKRYLDIKDLNTEEIYNITTSAVAKCMFSRVAKLHTNEFQYSLGDVINTSTGKLKILNSFRKQRSDGRLVKYYTYQCLNDGYIGDISQSQIRMNEGCRVCANKIVIPGFNDIETTAKWMTKYIKNKADCSKYSARSNKKIKMKCPKCGFEKMKIIGNMYSSGFGCQKCEESASSTYEKFLINMLEQACVKFEIEYSPKLANGKRYDFYLPDYNLLIEVDGGLHNQDDIMENDRMKDSMAKENGLDIIRICFRKGEHSLNYIKNQIMHTELKNIINIENVNWSYCFRMSVIPKIKNACSLWNEGEDTFSISKILGKDRGVITNYLKIGKDIGICDYKQYSRRGELY